MKRIEPNNLGVFVCPHVFQNTRPVLYVCREDGDWQFLCGDTDHGSDGHLVGVGHLTERDPTLHELSDLKPNCGAEREGIGAPWVYKRCE